MPSLVHNNSQKRGFALVIGVAVAAILISVTFVMFSITLKQVTLATAGRNSQLAFYAADTGIECALYANYKIDNAFAQINSATDGSGNTHIDLVPPSTIPDFRCNNKKITYTPAPGSITINGVTYNEAIVSRFQVDYLTGNQCALLTVTKYVKPIVIGGITVDTVGTKIESRGYNTCVNISDPQRVERGLEVYQSVNETDLN
jgi:Tfp pilus assembly protein PilX